MIITAIGNGNVVCAMSANESMVLLQYLTVGFTEKDMDHVSCVLAAHKNVDVPPKNVLSHLEAIRVQLHDYETTIYPHLAKVVVEAEKEPVRCTCKDTYEIGSGHRCQIHEKKETIH